MKGPYCTTHDVMMTFCMPDFSSSNIIEQRLHVDDDKGELGIGYDMIIGHDLMIKLGLSADFKDKFLHWDDVKLTMKEPRCLIGK